MWSGQTDAAIETLELAQRIDPELNPFDRSALSLAYYLKQRYDAAAEQAEINLRENVDAAENGARVHLGVVQAERLVCKSAARSRNAVGDSAQPITVAT